jgi:predicted site-specific integrase-resolvase
VNTDQAFNLLMDAGVPENNSIQTVRRWLREGKIKYDGNSNRKAEYIIDDTDYVIELLKDAGVADSIGIQTVTHWLREGKIKYDGTRNRNTGYMIDETVSKLLTNNRTNQNKDDIIHQLKLKIKAQDEHIEVIEELHEAASKILILQRDKLNQELIFLQNEKSRLKNETIDLLKENIELRNELIKLKDKRFTENIGDNGNFHPTTESEDYRRKLGLSKKASNKELLAGYKDLLKIAHPDRGGNAKTFQYIKTDYDTFRNSIKD